MKITLLAHGTRGDVQPMVILGMRLAELGHDITMGASENYQAFVESAGLRFVPIPINLEAYIESEQGQGLLATGNVNKLVGGMAELHHAKRETFNAAVEIACDGCEAIVAMHLAIDRALVMGEKRRAPVAFVTFFPLLPTSAFPSPLMPPLLWLPAGLLSRLTHEVPWVIWQRRTKDDMNEFRCRLGMAPVMTPIKRRVMRPGSLTVFTFSEQVLPKPADWDERIQVNGYWHVPAALRAGLSGQLPRELEEWLAAGPAPVFLGFGSMPVKQPQLLLRMTAQATRKLGLRAVVNARWADGHRQDLPEHMFSVGAVNHDLLMPRCRAAVHHGGSSTTGASLAAGLPTMICAVWADQPFWATLLERRGVGYHVPFTKLSASTLERGLNIITQESARERAQELGARLREEGDRGGYAAQLVADYLSKASPPA
jgi:sterol 3beta-glucosyltransferase